MVEASLVASAAVSAFVLLAVGVALTRSRHRHPSLLGQAAAGSGFVSERGRSLDRFVEDPASWFLSFLLFAFGVAGAAMLVAVGSQPFANPLMYVAILGAAVGLIYGSYAAGRNSGLGSAGSTLVTASVLGVLATVAIVALLVVG